MTKASRDRLLDAGLRLIAERGFASVTVGDIEREAGFAPRGGTLYKNFESKYALLEAAMQRHIDSLQQFDELAGLLPLPDLRSELLLLGRWMLTRLDDEEAISRIIEKESHRFPHLLDAMREGLSDAGYRLAATYLHDRIADDERDCEALAVVFLGTLINLRRTAWTFGKPPMGLDDDRVLAAWVDVCCATLAGDGP